ncbi:uncharacterized protein LOC128398137 [Panonychus citri]|uniref:uncharacterized protein LOC128398137 n=1 Tax=Panonychus citri TaxID=50023 RepID=UPI00230703F7|nr:uncharacterized protein LOC128398137 [Panonychus citri]
MKMYPNEILIGLLTLNHLTGIILCSVLLPSNGLVSSTKSSPSKTLDSKVINPRSLSSYLPQSSSSSSSSSLPLPSSSYRSSNPTLHHLPSHHQIPLTPLISPNQPHLSSGFNSGLASGLRAKLSSMLPFWSRNSSPKAEKRALNLVRFKEQYHRGLPNAMALYNALLLESHERRWMLNDPSLHHPYPPGHPTNRMHASERKVGKVVNRIMSNFVADCVGVVITEIFRKVGEIAGELARLMVSNTAQHFLGREQLSLRSSSSSSLLSSSSSILPSPSKSVSRLIQAIKPKTSSDKKTA